jgi:perosamine synthetase
MSNRGLRMNELATDSRKLPSQNGRSSFIPYGRQWVDEEDIAAVVEVLRSDWLTTGPMVEKFEEAIANFVGAKYAVGVSSGTAALHAAMYAVGISPGDEVIVPAMTFVATANAVVFQGGIPVFVDVDPNTLLIDPAKVEEKINARTKAVIAVDYAGQPCDYDALREIADRHGLVLVADACHSLGGEYKRRKVGTLADLTVFSFHPVKHITTGEGGMVVTDKLEFAAKIRRFRNHGITTDHYQRDQQSSWFYEMVELGYNYRLTDIQCALGLSQLRKLPGWILRRQEIAQHYDVAFLDVSMIEPLKNRLDVSHAYHLYVVQLRLDQSQTDRSMIFRTLRAEGIGVNVHYIPIHLHSFYRKRFGTERGLCPVAEAAYELIISLPLFPHMTDGDVEAVVITMREVTDRFTNSGPQTS